MFCLSSLAIHIQSFLKSCAENFKDKALMMQRFAPGARVEIRDEEWVVRRVDRTTHQGYQLTCEGISELVRGKDALFLSDLEDEIKVLDPKDTTLVQDMSPNFSQGRLFIESQLRQSTPSDDQIHIAQEAAMDLVPYQLDPALIALKQPRQRILIADAVGLGKTLEAGILTTELMQRGRGKRILVLTLKSMMTQFQKEFWNRFSIPLTRLDSQGLQRVRGRIPANHNPFYYYDKSIISIDTLKQDNEFKMYLEKAYWDIIIIDEVHNVADRGTSSQRTELAQLLSRKSDTLIMLSATPHDGRAKSFASLMNMLDPTAISDPEHYTKDDFSGKGLVVRRFKHDIKDQVKNEFKERTVHAVYQNATAKEEAIYQALLDISFTIKGGHNADKPGQLVRIGLQKALFSSPAACLKSVRQRIKVVSPKDGEASTEAVKAELNGLYELKQRLQELDNKEWSKYQHLIETIKSKDFSWSAKDTNDRLVIFSERIETLNTLEAQLSDDLKLNPNQITQLHGGMSDIEQQEIVERFGKPEDKLRVLLCSDVASEGINLHYQSHRLVHFDLPWSLMVFQQRNGRVDRYGQEQDPHIYYLVTQSQNDTIRGDMRILEILQQKDEQAYENIGDPATFMDVFDSDKEAELTADAMAEQTSAEVFDAKFSPNEQTNEGEDLLSLFLAAGGGMDSSESTIVSDETTDTQKLTLFESDYDFSKSALRYLNKGNKVVNVEFVDDKQIISLTAPDDLKHKFRAFPPEIYPDNGDFLLTANKQAYMDEVKRSRHDDNAWPKHHYLWRKHPVMEWLQERMMGNTGRHEALVLGLHGGLELGHAIFMVSALIPNRKAHPAIWNWYGVHVKEGKVAQIEPLTKTLETYAVILNKVPNSGTPVDISALEQMRGPVIEAVKARIMEQQQAFDDTMQPKLKAQFEELAKLKGKQEQQMELTLGKQLASTQQSHRMKQQRHIDRVFSEYQQWVEDTWQTEAQPYIQLISILAPVAH
jgi:superfamily II DNA or RNA helicase